MLRAGREGVLQQVHRVVDVTPLPGIVAVLSRDALPSEMHDVRGRKTAQSGGVGFVVGQIGMANLHPIEQVANSPCRIRVAQQHQCLSAARDQMSQYVRPEKSRSAGDRDFHAPSRLRSASWMREAAGVRPGASVYPKRWRCTVFAIAMRRK